MYYTVSFDTGGGTPVPDNRKVRAGDIADEPDVNPTKAGYIFLFWSLRGASDAYDFRTAVKSDISLVARWDEGIDYLQVSWELNGGAWPADDNHVTQVVKGESLAEPVAPVRTDYIFEGWYKDEDLAGKISFPYRADAVTDGFTLYAKWKEVGLEVSWELNGGAWPADDNHATRIVKSEALAEPAPPVKTYNTFEGWYKEADLINRVSFPYNVSDTADGFTLYAKWYDIRSDYFGVWKSNFDNGGWEQFSISADRIVYLSNSGTSFTYENLSWIDTYNQGGYYTDTYTDGYRIRGPLAETIGAYMFIDDGSYDIADIGDIVAVSFYIDSDKQNIMVGNLLTDEQEAYFGPFGKISGGVITRGLRSGARAAKALKDDLKTHR
jgi:uncharacterized repeat protein (TIGR02543 family)